MNFIMKNMLCCNHKSLWLQEKPKCMRFLSAFILFVLMSSFTCNKMYAQSENFSFDVTDSTLRDILSVIEQKTGYYFTYNIKEISVEEKTTLQVENKTFSAILDILFTGKNIHYVVTGKHITLYKKVQQRVSGRITDINGEPVIGANVVEKGVNSNGTITDMEGRFSLSVYPHAILVVSYIGYKNVELPLKGKSAVNIVLQENEQALGEVVVVGFGTQKKVNLTGAVGIATAKDLKDRPVTTVTQALQGLVTGLNISAQNGNLNSSPTIDIRGIGTIGTGSSGAPLVLVDGAECDLSNINPQDIENISVLKDAASSSIYGSRAAFGVILITTKKGSVHNIHVDYNNNFRWSSPTILPNMMDSYSFATFINDADDNSHAGRWFSEEHLKRIKDFQEGKITAGTIEDPNNKGYWANIYSYGNDNINIYDYLYKNWAFAQEHNVSASGGNDRFTFYMSMGYLDQNGLLKITKDQRRRFSPTLKVDAKMADWMKLNYTTRFVRTDYTEPLTLSSVYYRLGSQSWPTLSIYDPNGYYINKNFLRMQAGNVSIQKDSYMNHAALILEPMKKWITTAELNYNINSYDTQQHQLKTYLHDMKGNPYLLDNTSYVSGSHDKDAYLNFSLYTTYDLTFRQSHNFKVLAGVQYENSRYLGMFLKRVGVIVDDLPVVNLTSGLNYDGSESTPEVSGSKSEWATAGYFGRINYDYNGRYLVEANIRYDGTSRFRSGLRWNWFPSFSFGWNVAKEKFWEKWVAYVNTLKLRASYGSLGNQNTSSLYPTYQTMWVASNAGTWLQNGAKPNASSAPNLISSSLTWERVRTWNGGLDVSMFDNRLNGSFDYFQRKTLNMVGPASELPNILGTDVPKSNNTDLKTYGWEVELAWRDKLENQFSYGVRLLLSDSQTKILRYPNKTKSLTPYYAGGMIGEIWGYETVGIAKTQTEMDAHLAVADQSKLGSEWRAGDIMYADLDGNGKVDNGSYTLEDHGDLKKIGNTTPRYRFGMDLNAAWKGFDLRLFFEGVGKRDYWTSSTSFWGIDWNGIWYTTPYVEHLDYFRAEPSNDLPANIDSYYPRPLITKANKNQQKQTRYLQNASYIRLKNLTVGYSLPKRISQKFFISNMRLFFIAENIWTITGLKSMFDPEGINGAYSGSGEYYPVQKTLAVGLSITL